MADYTGDSGDNTFTGGSGDDVIAGAGGADTLSGGAGNDALFAGYGDSVDGGDDSDTLYISFQGATSGVTVDFRDLYNNGSIVLGGGTLTNIESVGWVQGSEFGDTITDSSTDGNFAPTFGMGGDDHLIGGYYSGNVYGGDGNDTLRISLAGATTGITVDTSRFTPGGAWSLYGGTIQNIEALDSFTGSAFDDTFDIATQTTALTVYAGHGNDTVTSHGSSVTVDGGDGNDTFYSGTAADTFYGGDGFDTVSYANYTSGVTFDLDDPMAVGGGADGDRFSLVERSSAPITPTA